MDNLITRLARLCKHDTDPLKLRGKARDKQVVTWWIGAVRGLQAAAQVHSEGPLGADLRKDADWAERVLVFLISTRGYGEVEHIIHKAENPEEEVA